ncbi:MAG: hypothetical protein LBR38_07920 [Synergistaceae bacterium]|jgi:hypothetical protein|nr:hypothetical protein [Synergistaceae bacterium]
MEGLRIYPETAAFSCCFDAGREGYASHTPAVELEDAPAPRRPAAL